MNRRTRIAAVAAALLITAGAAGSATAAGDGRGAHREAAALTGTAKLYRPAGDDITFSFDAHLAAKDNRNPEAATGTFRFSHYKGAFAAAAEVEVDCLATGGKVAVVTGVITHGEGLLSSAVGTRVGISVHDTAEGRDRLGYSWMASNDPLKDRVPKCTSSAPFERTKAGSGDFRVLPWQPEYPTE
ncbi:Repetin [Streptomyces sp. NPDC004787]|uniref:Repetin n=1 Tax=Streptomyces sp. NPDC004787 TaxID=3154291 RepID=UPI0033BAAF18